MRWITMSGIMAMFMIVCFSPSRSQAAGEYVQITEPFVNIYQFLDPKSKVIKMAKKGDRLELIYAGTLWYNVKIGNETGWVERKAGNVIDQPSLVTPIVSILLIVIALGGTIFGVTYYIKKQKPVEGI
jgi:hypothetical protein